MDRRTGAESRTVAGQEEDMTVNGDKIIRNESFVDPINTAPKEATHHTVLLCAKCRTFLTKFDDVLADRKDIASAEQTYVYKVDIFDDKPSVWCYAVTRRRKKRYDVICCAPTIATRDHLVLTKGTYTTWGSFFDGYMFCACKCAKCKSFIGWAFSAVSGSFNDKCDEDSEYEETASASSTEPSFIALVFTKCTGEAAYPVEKIEESLRVAAGRYQFECKKDLLEMFLSGVLQQMGKNAAYFPIIEIFGKLIGRVKSDISAEEQLFFVNKAVDCMQAAMGRSELGKSKLGKTELGRDGVSRFLQLIHESNKEAVENIAKRTEIAMLFGGMDQPGLNDVVFSQGFFYHTNDIFNFRDAADSDDGSEDSSDTDSVSDRYSKFDFYTRMHHFI